MVAKKESNKTTNGNVMDFFLNDWWNQFTSFEKMEQQSIQGIESQKEWIDGTREQLCQLEENSKKLTTEWKTSAQSLFENSNNQELSGQDYQEWLNKVEEIGHKSQTIAFLPGKTSLEILSKSTAQFEGTFVKTVEQNQKIRDETTKAFDGVFEQMKQTQKSMFQFFDFKPGIAK
ncbi:hypothetical protein [Oceanobacillus sp. CF4.6]|uniref:hypothetical protein n=1 Tax=Oceanobacillus sp. CF4.6 TaxID=3373080 RepID=UPI003EE6EAAF